MTPDDILAIESMCAIAENPLLYDEPGPAQMLAAWCRKLLAERAAPVPMTPGERDRLVRYITLGLGDYHTEAQKAAIMAEVNLLAAAVITTAQQAVLDAAEAWAKATDSRLEKFFALHDAAVAMVAEKGNQNEDRNEI